MNSNENMKIKKLLFRSFFYYVTFFIALLILQDKVIGNLAFSDSSQSTSDSQKNTNSKLNLEGYTDKKFSSGFSVQVVERHKVPMASITMHVMAGSAFDPKSKDGLANFVAFLLKQGAGPYSAEALAETIDEMGAKLLIEPTRDGVFFSLNVLSRDFEKGMKILSYMLLNPIFDNTEFEKLKRQHIAAIQEIQDNPSESADVAFFKQLYRNHQYAHNPKGSVSSLEKMTKDDVIQFHKNYYRPDLSTMAVVGDVKPKNVLSVVNKLFSSWTVSKPKIQAVSAVVPAVPPPVIGKQLVVLDRAGAAQAQIRIGNIAFNAQEPLRVPINLANIILGNGFTSRLMEEIRVNRSLSYTAKSFFSYWMQPGPFFILTFTKNETVGETLNVALDTLSTLKKDGLVKGEFEKGKSFGVGIFVRGVESQISLAKELVALRVQNRPISTLKNYAQEISSVTDESFKLALSKIPSDNLLIVIDGDYNSFKSQIESFKPEVISSIDSESVLR